MTFVVVVVVVVAAAAAELADNQELIFSSEDMNGTR